MEKFFKNPVNPSGNDPFVTRYRGMYYYCYSTRNGVNVTSAEKLEDIHKIPDQTVYQADPNDYFSKEFWAPELHRLDGRWYIYVAADDGNNDHHRMIVLGADSEDPTGSYSFLGKLAVEEPYDKWAIDGTVLNLKDRRYFIWSGWSGDVNVQQNLYIARMSSPTSLVGKRVLISTPEFPWETGSCGNGLPTINEGPAVLQRRGKTFLIYSASGSWSDDYCLGMLTLVGEDPMDPASWVKCETPVFSAVETAYGPGHCSFTQSPDGSEDYIVYHANEHSHTSWGGRSLRIQKFGWKEGIPDFQKPVLVGEKCPCPSVGNSSLDTILFDLDGTLLPMWQDEFVKEYLKKVCELICPKGYSPDAVVKALWKGTDAMMANEQKKSNHDVFWEIFRQELGEKIDSLYEELLLFYQNEFDTVKKVVKEQRNCRLMIESLKKKGYRLALTTNPVFPSVAVRTRLSWIGLVPDDFEWVSDYENSDCCKPSLLYFEKALQYLGSRAESTLLVGNSVSEDLPASKLGIKTYFISDFSENPNGLPIVSDYQGKYEDFEKFVADLPPVRE